jgi:hypothetical protein
VVFARNVILLSTASVLFHWYRGYTAIVEASVQPQLAAALPTKCNSLPHGKLFAYPALSVGASRATITALPSLLNTALISAGVRGSVTPDRTDSVLRPEYLTSNSSTEGPDRTTVSKLCPTAPATTVNDTGVLVALKFVTITLAA